MGASPRKFYLTYLLTITLLFGVIAQLEGPIRWTREAEGGGESAFFVGNEPSEVVTLILGGLRALAVDAIWVRAMTAQEERQWHEIVLLMNLIQQLQPHFEEVYIFNGWNMAYNISHEAETLEEKWGWILEGYNFLRLGARKNPHLYRIKFWAGWVLFDKMSQNFDPKQRQYFVERYMKENNGRHPLIDAGLWFERANRTPGYQLKVHRTMMVHAYARLAEFYYLRNQDKKFWEAVERRSQLIEEVLQQDPENEGAINVREEWLLYLSRLTRAGEQLPNMSAQPAEAASALQQVLEEWDREVQPKHNPYGVLANRERARLAAVLAEDALARLKDEKAACQYWLQAYASLQILFLKFPEIPNLKEELDRVKSGLERLGCKMPQESSEDDI